MKQEKTEKLKEKLYEKSQIKGNDEINKLNGIIRKQNTAEFQLRVVLFGEVRMK